MRIPANEHASRRYDSEGLFVAPDPGRYETTYDLVESHISVLIFLGERVYKLRKPVRFDFVDFTSREAREIDCRREVELNSRFAPDVYLGVLDLVEEGHLVDHAVVMRRLPSERRLSVLVRSKDDDARKEVDALARLLVEADQYALHSPAIDEAGSRRAIAASWRANFEQTARFIGPIIDPSLEGRLQVLVERFLAGRGPLFEARIAAGAVRDGHGDLEADDIYCLEDGPRVLDCIEFDDTLRYGDVLCDLGFLAMDLERLGRPDLGEALFASYEEYAGVLLPRRLAYHYCASRAYVRLKVACLGAEEGLPNAGETARALQRLTVSFLERARVRLVVVGGLPGTGKSTLAAGLAEQLDMIMLRSDEVRREIAPAGDRYRPEITASTYATLFARARSALELGQSVVLDASFVDEDVRAEARRLAEQTASDLYELCCAITDKTARKRIQERARRGDDLSEADVAVAYAMASRAASWPEAEVVDTSGTRAATLAKARALIA